MARKDIHSAYRRIEDSGVYLLGLINDILNLSKVEAGKNEFIQTAVSVNEMIESVVIDVHNYANSKEKDSLVQIKTSIDQGVPDKLNTDKQKLRQVLLNLCSNAIKFTEKGEIGGIYSGHFKLL